MQVGWLGYEILGNPLGDWAAAAGIAAGAFLLLLLAQSLVVRRLGAVAPQTETAADDFFVELVRRTRRLLLLIVVIWLGSLSLTLTARTAEVLRTAAVLAFLLQMSLWALVAVNFWVEHTRRKRLASDAASVTLIGAVGFVAKAVVWSVLLLVALDNLGVDVTTLVAGLGVGGIAVGLALQNILGDLFASVSIVLDKPFVVGETIQVGDLVGKVESIGLKTTHVRSLSGEQIIFPNGDLLQSRIRNHARMGDRRVVLSFGVPYETPVGKVEAIPGLVRGIVEGLEQLRFDRAHLLRLGTSALDFEVVYFVLSTDHKLHMDRQQQILVTLMRRLEEEGIELASPARPVVLATKGELVRKVISSVAVLFMAAAAAWAQTDGGTRLLRYPDIHGDTVVFTYAGDLWLANVSEASGASGTTARRLTSHPGEEHFARFSPDGRQVAFTAEYSGNRQVHVISVDGGNARQLTFRNDIGEIPLRGGYDNQVLDWTPDGKQVLFQAHRVPWSDRIGRLYVVPAAGGMETPLPMREGSGGTFSPDGTRIAYTPIMREFRTWKRYKGGRAQDIWVYDLAHDTAERVTDFIGTDNLPVWIGDTLYFTSDREGGILDLYALDLKTRSDLKSGQTQPKRVTTSTAWDVLWPGGDARRVVYQSGGWIWLFDPAPGSGQPQTRRLTIRIPGDLPQALPYFANVTRDVQAMALSPTGKRAVFEARGEVLTVPAEEGEIRDLTGTSGVREMTPAWSPDGRWIAYLSDRTGEYEIWVRAGDGTGEERQVTRGGDSWRYPPVWSPDSKKIAFSDKQRRLRYVELDGGRIVDVDRSHLFDITDYRWAPDSGWLTYTKIKDTSLPAVWVWSLEQKKGWQLTEDMTAAAEPVFDPSGKYLFFLSNRDYNLTFSGFELNYVYTNPTRVYVGILTQDGPALFLPKSDEEEPAEEASARKEGGDKGKGKPEPVRIDPEGFERRVRALPGSPGNYRNLLVGPGAVYYIVDGDGTPQLRRYDLKEQKEDVILSGLQGYDLSANGQKILYRQGNTYGIIDPRPGQGPGAGKLPMNKLEIRIDPRAEWEQMYVDAWRTMRDWFYDPALHGVDWKGLRARYGELLPYMASHHDLELILSELGAEISAGHVYVEKGNDPGVERVENGLLGAEVEAHSSGYFKIARIFPGENWHDDFRSPLTEPGVDVKPGDYILAVDGQTTKGVDNFYRLLQNKAGRVVTLRVNSRPSDEGAREARVRPVDNEQNLRYLEWVQANRAKVEKASGGRIGYIHTPDTAIAGNRELFRGFYPQAHKDALIIDDRYNNGGLVPDRMIELLSRPLLNYWAVRGMDFYSTPAFVHTGPKAMLVNGLAGSGGDALPFYFRKLGLGPLIGTKTWGGLAGLNGSPSLVDGSQLTTPSFRFFATDGQWAVENEGVTPDMEVVDRPDALAKGQDPSLEAAIDYLLKELEKNPPQKVKVPVPPKSGPVR